MKWSHVSILLSLTILKENDWNDRCALTSGILSLTYGGGGAISPYAVNTLEVQHKV